MQICIERFIEQTPVIRLQCLSRAFFLSFSRDLPAFKYFFLPSTSLFPGPPCVQVLLSPLHLFLFPGLPCVQVPLLHSCFLLSSCTLLKFLHVRCNSSFQLTLL